MANSAVSVKHTMDFERKKNIKDFINIFYLGYMLKKLLEILGSKMHH